MPYTFSVFTNANEIPFQWKSFFLNDKKCMQSIENAKTENITNFYVITLFQHQAVYFSYYQLLHVKPTHFNLSNCKHQQFSLNVVLKCVKPTLLVAGNLFRHDAYFFDFDKKHKQELPQYFVATTNYMIKKTNASGIFLKDIKPSISATICKDKSYSRMENDIAMKLKIHSLWKTISDYEFALKHKYAQRYRKIKKSFEGIQIQELTLIDIEKYQHEMEQLYLQVVQKQMVSMGVLNHHFFVEFKKLMHENYKVCGYFLNRKLIAFSSAILHDNTYDMNYIGFDYNYNQSHNLYFNILFHCVEMAIHNHCNELILGRTAIEAKAIIGCEAYYPCSFYKLRNPIMNVFFKRISSYFTEQQGVAWQNRHPFKNEYYLS